MSEGTPNEFDPKEYRDDLADQIRTTKKEGREKLEAARESGDKNRVYDAMWEVTMKKREKIELARWNEEYYRAKLLTHGNFTRNEAGEMVENESGLTTEQLAARARLQDSFGYDIERVLEAIDKVGFKPENLRSRKLIKEARYLFQTEVYHRQKDFIENPEQVRRFVEIFGLEDDLNAAVSRQLDSYVANSYREGAEQLLAAYPIFDQEEYRRRLLARSYPVSKGLKDAEPQQELFSRSLTAGEKEERVSLKAIAAEMAGKSELLANDFKVVPAFYWNIKACMSDMDMRGARSVYHWLLRRDKSLEDKKEERVFVKAMYLFDEVDNKNDGQRSRAMVDNPLRLELRFSADRKTVDKEERWGRMFATPNTFQFEGAFLGNEALYAPAFGGKKTGFLTRIDKDAQDYSKLEGLSVSKEALRDLAESIIFRERDVSRSIGALRKLAVENNLPATEVADLETALREYGTYMYTEETSHVGACLIIPSEFSGFVREKFGIEIDQARYGEYHPEWGDSMGYDPFTFYHEVNVYAKQLVIDWTVTQYSSHADKPMPYVYKIGDEGKRFGPLYKIGGERGNPNVLYIPDPNEPPIEYGY